MKKYSELLVAATLQPVLLVRPVLNHFNHKYFRSFTSQTSSASSLACFVSNSSKMKSLLALLTVLVWVSVAQAKDSYDANEAVSGSSQRVMCDV